jgi:hypothetical protein
MKYDIFDTIIISQQYIFDRKYKLQKNLTNKNKRNYNFLISYLI